MLDTPVCIQAVRKGRIRKLVITVFFDGIGVAGVKAGKDRRDPGRGIDRHDVNETILIGSENDPEPVTLRKITLAVAQNVTVLDEFKDGTAVLHRLLQQGDIETERLGVRGCPGTTQPW